MNYYLASQRIAERQAALAADLTHRAQLKDARAARKASVVSADRRSRTARLFFGRLAHSAA